MYFDATRRLDLLQPMRLEDLKHLTRRIVCRRIFPPFQPTPLIADHRTCRKTPCQKKCMVLREKEKQFIFDEVCPLKFHYEKLMMLGTIGPAIMSRDVILRI
jgi:hypothetical protein